MNKRIIWGVVIIAVFCLAWYLVSPLFITKEANEQLPVSVGDVNAGVEGLTLYNATLIASAHEVLGIVKIIGLPNEKRVLRFEDFDTTNGPDLFIYLATDKTAYDFVNLGEIKATRGNVNYDIPLGTDLKKYDTVLIWCKSFSVLFSYAEI